jgi:IPT/TIG domain
MLYLQRGGYYGHPNHKRAISLPDSRQCVWHAAKAPSSGTLLDGYTSALMMVPSSMDGIIEFESDHFGGEMRGDLILSKYKGKLYRVVLMPDGVSANPYTNPAVELTGDNGLAVTQAPDGSLIDARHDKDELYSIKPVEPASSAMDIKSVFPRRGRLAGGSKFMIFGVNFNSTPNSVKVGGNACTNVVLVSSKKITCTLPAGTEGRHDVEVVIGASTDTFKLGYRYITGVPAV